MYSGDETGGLVADYGSHTSKFGYAGEDCPRMVRRTLNDFPHEYSRAIQELCPVSVEPSDHPVMLTVPTLLETKDKVQWASKAFELGAPAVFLLRSPVAAAFASGKSTALVVEVGASGTTVSPVFEGYSLLRCTRRSETCGGQQLSKNLASLIAAQLPMPSANANPFKSAQYWDRVDDIKHSCCQVWRNVSFNEQLVTDAKEYALPDGKTIRMGKDRFAMCEQLFDAENGIAALVYDALASCEPDLRRTFSQEIVVVGGGSLLDGLPERLGAELAARLPLSFKPRIQTPGSTVERRFAPFVGASVLASLGSFQQLWLSKKEWEEAGEKSLIEKCVQ